MVYSYNETFYSKLNSDIQEKMYIHYMKASPRDKLLLFTKLKYGDNITFKDISEKMHFSTARNVYAQFINIVSGSITSGVVYT